MRQCVFVLTMVAVVMIGLPIAQSSHASPTHPASPTRPSPPTSNAPHPTSPDSNTDTHQPSVAWRQTLAMLRTGKPARATLNQFAVMWQRFDQQGLFNVGTPQTALDQTLGEPDAILLMDNDLYRHVYGYMAIDLAGRKVASVTDLRGLALNILSAWVDQEITLNMGEQPWRVNYRCRRAFTTLAEWTLPDEQVQNWTKLVTIQRLHLQGRTSAGRIANQFIDTLKKNGHGILGKTIDMSDKNVTLEWSIPQGKNQPEQHEIMRYMTHGDDVIRIAYTVRGTSMDIEERSIWLHRLRQASTDDQIVNAKRD